LSLLKFLILPFVLLFLNRHLQENSDPTGTYYLSKQKTIKGKELTFSGRYCELRVNLLENEKISLELLALSGYPEYDSLHFIDTVFYNKSNSTCLLNPNEQYKLKLRFSKKGVKIKNSNSINFAFSSNRIELSGFYRKKISSLK
jgi:hypothetical protein